MGGGQAGGHATPHLHLPSVKFAHRSLQSSHACGFAAIFCICFCCVSDSFVRRSERNKNAADNKFTGGETPEPPG